MWGIELFQIKNERIKRQFCHSFLAELKPVFANICFNSFNIDFRPGPTSLSTSVLAAAFAIWLGLTNSISSIP